MAISERKPQTRKAATPPLMATLRAEHVHLESVAGLLEEQLNAIEAGKPVDAHVLYEIMNYLGTWADRYHHPREDLIYGRAAELDRQLADDVDSLQRQHDSMARKGQALQQSIAGWRDGTVDSTTLVGEGRAYLDNSLNHMHSEEQRVFPRIEALLTTADWRELELDDRLQPAGDPLFGARADREFRNLARKLKRGLRHRLEQGVVAEWAGLGAAVESWEIMCGARRSALTITGETVRQSARDSLRILGETPLTAGVRCAANNTRLGGRWLAEVFDIARDAGTDLARVNRERRDNIERARNS
ncbi:cation-binding protein [Kineobactrum sediminis]|uniref:Cation-binding protein n=1 Tax=Kineobactrum sediminis TaxID=1905677 RepID=A0A2N5XZL0_9GAMM|nr:hemerythrin domain-containing protein [Kineobactrum sediminis]PLW81576.1 cation-binding protein [Kineobactrum sediminis]